MAIGLGSPVARDLLPWRFCIVSSFVEGRVSLWLSHFPCVDPSCYTRVSILQMSTLVFIPHNEFPVYCTQLLDGSSNHALVYLVALLSLCDGQRKSLVKHHIWTNIGLEQTEAVGRRSVESVGFPSIMSTLALLLALDPHTR